MKTIYLIGSLRNPRVPEIGDALRADGFDVFDDWFSAGPEADDYWQKYEHDRGHTLQQALAGYHAQHVYAFDKFHLNRAHIGVLVMPAGKSGHIELGYLCGQGKPGFILFDKEPERFDVMHAFARGVTTDLSELISMLREVA